MDFETIRELALSHHYELITTQDGKGYMLVPMRNPHCMWGRFDSLEEVFNKLHSSDKIIVLTENKKRHYYLKENVCYTLKDNALCLNKCGFDVIVLGAKKGEHNCVVVCKDKSINLEEVVLHTNKTMVFAKFTHPFEKEWSGYYSASYIRKGREDNQKIK